MMSSKHLIRALNELNKFLRNFFVKKSFSILVTFLDIHPNKFYALCVGQSSPAFKLYWRRSCPISSLIRTNDVRKGQAQYPVWGQTNIWGQPTKEGIKLPFKERWSMLVRNWAVSEDDGHLGTFVRGIWWTY